MAVLLSSQGLSKSYGPRTLFAGISLDLREGERIGLIGPNGAGKSTLLKICAGVELPDTGTVARLRSARIGYLAQEPNLDPEWTVEEAVADALRDDPAEEHERATRVRITLGKTGFARTDQKVGTLSGGWRKRVAIARELARGPDLLLLDEPTNHLDLEGILWLEEVLQDASFAYVVVSHDRYLLENATNQIVELDHAYPEGYLRVTGSYSVFLERREEFLAGQARREEATANKVRREVEWLRRGAAARTGKSASRTKEAHRLIGELQALRTRNAPAAMVDLDFAATGRKSTKLVVGDGLAKTLGGRQLFRDVSFTLSPGTKLGLLGRNGSGKTTLIRLLTGELEPDSGTIRRADGVRVIAFDQDRRQLDRAATLRQALAENADTVVYRGRPYHVTAWAKRFLFRVEQLDLPVGDLSGGEQARILLARLMLQACDVLILDEPTNDLDIPSLEILEESLAEFPGALVLVSHDRALLDRLCSELIGLDGRGGARIFADFTQWAAAQREIEAAPKPVAAPKASSPPREKSRRLSYQEQREWASMEQKIMEAEQEVTARQQEVEAAGSDADHVRLRACCQALQDAQAAVEKLYGRWQELEAKQAKS